MLNFSFDISSLWDWDAYILRTIAGHGLVRDYKHAGLYIDSEHDTGSMKQTQCM